MQATNATETATVPAADPALAVDFATAQFRDFYGELERALLAAARVGPEQAADSAQSLSNELLQLIELQSLAARRVGGRHAQEWDPQARFLKAALADEVLLNVDWAGRSHWRHVLLEARLFRSSLAGDKVFADIEELLALREPAQRDLARLYLYALSLGFQGRLRDSPQIGRLADLRRELFQFVYQRPADLHASERAVSQSAYDSTLSYLSAARLPRLSRWGVAVGLVMLLLLGLSQVIWLWQSWPLRQLASVAALGGGEA